ncbi:MAG: phosphatidate cytidylyltransferase [Betaproteobacteria bacterium]|nr:phosphatidate cytidylyltransferase [Betaproteobacteria bacterium]
MLRTRVLTAVLALIVLIGAALWAPAFGFDVLLLAIMMVALYEWLGLLGILPRRAAAIAAALGLVGVASLVYFPSIVLAAEGQGAALLPLYLLATLAWVVVAPIALSRGRSIGSPSGLGPAAAFVLCFATWLALLQADGIGKVFLLSVLLLVWVADTAAYFAGRAFGRRKLAPAISPGKTWEGVFGALAGNLLLAAMAIALAEHQSGGFGPTIFSLINDQVGGGFLFLFVILITLVSVVGDLYESLLKRLRGVKDSSGLLPGHGGVLDRIDALMAVFPVTMAMVSLLELWRRGSA